MSTNHFTKLLLMVVLTSTLSGCIGAVVGVAVDTTTAVIKAPFQLTGAVIEVAADTTGTVIAAPFRAVDAAFGGGHDHSHDSDHDHEKHHGNHRGHEQ